MNVTGGSTAGAYRFWGIAFALAGTISFAFRPILIKLGYASHPVSATTLLFLRMTLSLPFFLAMAWWLRGEKPIARRDWLGIVWLQFDDLAQREVLRLLAQHIQFGNKRP